MAQPAPQFLKLSTHHSLPHRLLLSLLTGHPVRLSQIRSSTTHSIAPGLAPHEISLLRLLETLTNGTTIDISYSGTALVFQPGLVTGCIPGQGTLGADDVLEHHIPAGCRRGLSWYLMTVCLLAPFAKAHVNVRFSGEGCITAATAGEFGDMSVDSFRTGVLPLFSLFGIPLPRIELRVLQRSCAGPKGKSGGGVVELRFAAQVRLPRTLHLNRAPGKIKRVRGVAYSTGVSASNNGRMIYAAREVLNELISDMHIAAQYDQAPLVPTDKAGGKKRVGIGFGLSLVAESSAAGVYYTADVVAPPEGGAMPEDIGKQCALQLLEEIERGGCVSSAAAPVVLTLMAMGAEDVGRVRLGRDVLAREEMVVLARDLRQFGGSAWGLREADDTDDIVVSVKGTGVGNIGRKLA